MYSIPQNASAPDESTSLWRYLDFAKFVELLEERRLVFVRSDQYEDPYEGEWSEAGYQLVLDQLATSGIHSDKVPDIWKNTRRSKMYLSCWHMSTFESAAMWSLYSRSTHAVAIRCKYVALRAALDSSPLTIFGSKVFYRDYAVEPIAIWGGTLYPFFNKRLSFEHEKEFRALIWQEADKNPDHIPGDTPSHGVSVDPGALLEQVLVHPQAPTWFGALVEKVVARYSTSIPVVRSSMYERPLR